MQQQTTEGGQPAEGGEVKVSKKELKKQAKKDQKKAKKEEKKGDEP